jgi:hypothetical protein
MTTLSTAFAQGLAASRPAAAASNQSFYYLATDTNGGTLYQSTGSAWVQLAPGVSAASGAMTKISATTLATAAATILLSSIPQSYSELRLVVTARSDAATSNTDLTVQLNGDTGANYDHEQLYATNATTTAGGNAGLTAAYVGGMPAATATTGIASTSIITLPQYAGTTWQKEIYGEGGEKINTIVSGFYLRIRHNWWRNAAAVTSLTLAPASGNFVSGTVAILYGIN